MRVSVALPAESGSGSEPAQSGREGKTSAAGGSPFQRASSANRRLKLMAWGDSGAGKTTLALQFPRPVVIDLEGGTDLYGDAFEFDVLRAAAADEVHEAVNWLLVNTHDYRTLVIDPITIYWDALQRKWSDIFLRRNKGTKGHRLEYYDFQPRDWMVLKAEFKELIRKLIALDMNVVATARQKVQYADSGFMRAVGHTFDGEKSLPYLFDTIVRLFRDGDGRFMGECLKDRSNRLPQGEFECSYQHFEKLLGRDSLTREAVPIEYATDDQKRRIRRFIAEFDLPHDQVLARLASYGAECLDDLTRENADLIIGKFESATAARDGEKETENAEG